MLHVTGHCSHATPSYCPWKNRDGQQGSHHGISQQVRPVGGHPHARDRVVVARHAQNLGIPPQVPRLHHILYSTRVHLRCDPLSCRRGRSAFHKAFKFTLQTDKGLGSTKREDSCEGIWDQTVNWSCGGGCGVMGIKSYLVSRLRKRDCSHLVLLCKGCNGPLLPQVPDLHTGESSAVFLMLPLERPFIWMVSPG